jgi:hypothetical protein
MLIMVLLCFLCLLWRVFKEMAIKVPLLISLYVQIAFALIYHFLFILFRIDPINASNVASVLYAVHFHH